MLKRITISKVPITVNELKNLKSSGKDKWFTIVKISWYGKELWDDKFSSRIEWIKCSKNIKQCNDSYNSTYQSSKKNYSRKNIRGILMIHL